jgi:pimeloyl-ACP methyl ester carboxylesterase
MIGLLGGREHGPEGALTAPRRQGDPRMIQGILQQLLYPAPAVPLSPFPPPPWERVALPSSQGEGLGWLREAPGASCAPALLWFHGNGENLETLRLAGLLGELEDLGCPSLAVEYPGYGGLPGAPSEGSLREAARNAVAWASDHWPGRSLVACGWSLGAAVALPLAAEAGTRIRALAVFSAWTRLAEVARLHFPAWLVSAVLRESYDSLALASHVRLPALVAHGGDDGIIPAGQGRQLAQALAGPVRHLELPGVGHNDLLAHRPIWKALETLIDELEAPA